MTGVEEHLQKLQKEVDELDNRVGENWRSQDTRADKHWEAIEDLRAQLLAAETRLRSLEIGPLAPLSDHPKYDVNPGDHVVLTKTVGVYKAGLTGEVILPGEQTPNNRRRVRIDRVGNLLVEFDVNDLALIKP